MTALFAAARRTLSRLIGHFKRSEHDGRFEEEMQFHVDMSAQRRAAAGAPPERARREALVAFGARERFREESRDAHHVRLLQDVTQDLRYAVRNMRKRMAPAAIIVLTLSLGIGALTTVFSVVNSVLLKPLPYPDSGRLVTVWQQWAKREPGPESMSPAEYFDYVDRQQVLGAFGVYTGDFASLTSEGEPERVPVGLVSGGVFAALGVQPVAGRLIAPEHDSLATTDVVVLTNGLWHRRYGGRPDIIGQRIIVDRQPMSVIGVLPAGFRLPDELSSSHAAELFVPLGLRRDRVIIRGSHFLSVVGRLKAGTSVAQAASNIGDIARAFSERFPADYPAQTAFRANVLPLQESIVGASRSSLLLLLVAVGCVMLIACVNAASLLLAQAETRSREMAVRSALGAARPRLVRQLLVESALLAALAGVGGVSFTLLAVRALKVMQPVGLPRLETLSVDGMVLAFALLISAVAAVSAGLMPALQLVRSDLQTTIRSSGRSLTSSGAQRRMRRLLVSAEMAIAVVLLLGAGLLTTSFARLLRVDPGFSVDHVITMPITLASDSSSTDDAVIGFFAQLTDRLRAFPDVRSVGAVAGTPLVAPRGDMGVTVDGHPVPVGANKPQVDWQVVTPGYMSAIGMKLKRGRDIAATDSASTPGVAVINETMARRLWPNEDAMGRRFTLGGGAKPAPVTVIGIVGDVHQAGLGVPPDMEMYIPHAQFRFWGGGGVLRSLSVVVNSRTEPGSLVPRIREAVHALSPTVPLGTVRTMEEVRAASVAEPRFMMVLLLLAAFLALTIAMVGIYGIVAYYVAQRRREFGMRVALGATRRDIAALVLREGIVITIAGIAIGVPAAIGFARLLQSFLYDVKASDPLLLLCIPAALALSATLASYLPARRAARTDPMMALRQD